MDRILKPKLVSVHDAESVHRLNQLLPPDIKIHSIKRVTKHFNSKGNCDARTYQYLTPTFAFCPVEEVLTEDFRMSEEIRSKVNATLKEFVGVHYYHNYTSGK